MAREGLDDVSATATDHAVDRLLERHDEDVPTRRADAAVFAEAEVRDAIAQGRKSRRKPTWVAANGVRFDGKRSSRHRSITEHTMYAWSPSTARTYVIRLDAEPPAIVTVLKRTTERTVREVELESYVEPRRRPDNAMTIADLNRLFGVGAPPAAARRISAAPVAKRRKRKIARASRKGNR